MFRTRPCCIRPWNRIDPAHPATGIDGEALLWGASLGSRPAGYNIDGIETQQLAAAHFGLEAEPVGAEQPTAGVEGDGGRDLSGEVVLCTGQQPLADVVRPGHAADQRLIQELAREGCA